MRSIIKGLACWTLLAAIAFDPSMARAGPNPKLAASIAPIQSLVAGVAGEENGVVLLIPAGHSPHTYQLRASTLRELAQADLVFLVSGEFETALAKPVSAEGLTGRAVELAFAPDVKLLKARERHDHEGGELDDHIEEREAPASTDPHSGFDMHFWLDPRNAIAAIKEIEARLRTVDPSKAEFYAANASAYIAQLSSLDEALERELAPVREEPYVVFHDAFQYLERRYGLLAPSIVTVAADRPPSAKRVSEIRGYIKAKRAKCIFAEPQFSPPILSTIVEGLDVRAAELDPLGVGLEAGAGLYPDLLTRLASNLSTCLRHD